MQDDILREDLIDLIIHKNLVYIDKRQDYQYFLRNFLIKYEEVLQPDYYSIGKRRFKTVRELRELYSEDNYFIKFSRGLLEVIPNSEYRIASQDKENIRVPEVSFEDIQKSLKVFDLRDDQVIAVNKCLKLKRGVIQLPTATGKSAIITATIKQLLKYNPNIHILVLAPTLSTIKNINDSLIENDIKSEIFSKPNKEIRSPVTTSLVQSLIVQSKKDPNLLDEIDAVFYDECHHLKCDTWNQLNLLLPNVEYSLGFSALSIDKKEIFLTDIRDISYDASLIIGSSGRVIMHMDPSYYIERGIIALPIIFRISNHISLPINFDESKWHQLVKTGLMSTARTEKVAEVSRIFSQNNRKVLILTSEKNYAFIIGRFLRAKGCTKFGISFGAGNGYIYDENGDQLIEDTSYKDKDSLEVLDCLSNDTINILIATSHLDEGVDVKNLDVCILACGGKSNRKIIQRVGRALRKSKTGKYAYIVDFTDTGSSVLNRQSRLRLKMYKEDIGVPLDKIYDNLLIEDVLNKFKELEG